MNEKIKMVCINQRLAIAGFKTQLDLAAREDDGTIDKAERKALKELTKAAEALEKKLEKYI